MRGRERATRNQRGVEFRGYRGEREKGGERGEKERERARGQTVIREEGREGIDNGEPGVTAILYLARHDRVNELSLRGGPTAGYPFPSLGLSLLRELRPDEIVTNSTTCGPRIVAPRSADSRAAIRGLSHPPVPSPPLPVVSPAISANSCEFRQSRRMNLRESERKKP